MICVSTLMPFIKINVCEPKSYNIHVTIEFGKLFNKSYLMSHTLTHTIALMGLGGDAPQSEVS